MGSHFLLRTAPALACALLLGACAVHTPPATMPAPPAGWQAALPHQGSREDLARWWQQQGDPLLSQLIDEAQAGNPTLAQSLARLNQARAAARSAGAGLWPAVNASAQASRAREPFAIGAPAITNTGSLALDAQWELDLFGGTRHQATAENARAEAAGYDWHEARISLAADVAQTYVSLRSCEALAEVYRQESESQGKTADLTRRTVQAGLDSPANGNLADAGAAEASTRLIAQRAECDAQVKALVLLTGRDEPGLRTALAPRRGLLPQSSSLAVDAVPAQLLRQRPDLAAAERRLIAAAAEVGVADAARYPRLTLTGNVARAAYRGGGAELEGLRWGFGPSLVLPIFSAGRVQANVDAAQARYEEARAGLDAQLRQAVREVEEALVRLDAARRREADAQRSADGFRKFFASTEQRWQVGAGSLIEMEDARRRALAAQATLLAVQREQAAGWITLYKAVGGGWTPEGVQAAANETNVANDDKTKAN